MFIHKRWGNYTREYTRFSDDDAKRKTTCRVLNNLPQRVAWLPYVYVCFFSISFLFFTSFISFFYTHVKSVVFFILMYTGALPQYAPVYDGCLSIPPAYVWEPERRPIAEPFVEKKRKGKGSKYWSTCRSIFLFSPKKRRRRHDIRLSTFGMNDGWIRRSKTKNVFQTDQLFCPMRVQHARQREKKKLHN